MTRLILPIALAVVIVCALTVTAGLGIGQRIESGAEFAAVMPLSNNYLSPSSAVRLGSVSRGLITTQYLPVQVTNMTWTADGRSLLVAGNAQLRSLHRIDYDGISQITRLLNIDDLMSRFGSTPYALSPDRRQIAIIHRTNNETVFFDIIPVDSDGSRLLSVEGFGLWSPDIWMPYSMSWSPRGTHVLYAASREDEFAGGTVTRFILHEVATGDEFRLPEDIINFGVWLGFGDHLLYQYGIDPNTRYGVVDVAAMTARDLVRDPDIRNVINSPDGQHIAYLRPADQTGGTPLSVVVQDITTGDERTLATVTDYTQLALDWLGVDTIVVTDYDRPPQTPSGGINLPTTYRVRIDGDDTLTRFDASEFYTNRVNTAQSPDGRYRIEGIFNPAETPSSIRPLSLVDTQAGQSQPIAIDMVGMFAAWSADGRYAAIYGAPRGNFTLTPPSNSSPPAQVPAWYLLDPTTNTVRRLATASNPGDLSWSPQGHVLVLRDGSSLHVYGNLDDPTAPPTVFPERWNSMAWRPGSLR